MGEVKKTHHETYALLRVEGQEFGLWIPAFAGMTGAMRGEGTPDGERES